MLAFQPCKLDILCFLKCKFHQSNGALLIFNKNCCKCEFFNTLYLPLMVRLEVVVIRAPTILIFLQNGGGFF